MKSNFIKKIICVPNYLSMPTVGVDIGNRFIRYIDLNNKKGKLSLKRYGEVAIPSGVIKDGEILNKDILVNLLIELKKQFSSDFINISIPEDKNYIFNIKIPKVPEKEIRQILEFKIEENVPLKLDESYFEYEIVEEFSDKKELFLNVSVVPRKMISEYSEIFGLAGLYPLSFETESRMTAFSVIPKGSKKTFMIINIKDDSAVLSIVSGRTVCLTSTVSIGNYSIIESLSKSPEYKDKKIDKLPDDFFYSNKGYDINAFNSLLNIFSVFKDEIEKFTNYWLSQDDKTKNNFSIEIEKVFICGRSSALPSFREHIIQNLNVQIELANVWQNVFKLEDVVPDIKFVDSLDYAIPIGLALISHKKDA
ncbi:MAG: pilus assembly protein PilM [Candidatus Paceibacterota bacterium]|jgi:type IV pilus assembly protein PilM